MVIPAIDLMNSQVVRLAQGDYNQVTVYHQKPEQLASTFEAAGAQRLHIVDLEGAKQGRLVHTETIQKIRKTVSLVLEVGGGIRTLEAFLQLKELLHPQDKIMVGSWPIQNPKGFRLLAQEYASWILPTVDVWGQEIRIAGWKEKTSWNIHSFLEALQEWGIFEVLVTQIQRDGMLQGPDWDLYHKLIEQHPAMQFIVSGGVSSMADLTKAQALPGISGVILGRAFYEGKISLEACKEKGLFAVS